MASFYFWKGQNGLYHGRGNMFGTLVEAIGDSFMAIWKFFCGKKEG